MFTHHLNSVAHWDCVSTTVNFSLCDCWKAGTDLKRKQKKTVIVFGSATKGQSCPHQYSKLTKNSCSCEAPKAIKNCSLYESTVWRVSYYSSALHVQLFGPCTVCVSTVCAVNLCKLLTCLLQSPASAKSFSLLPFNAVCFSFSIITCNRAKWKHDWRAECVCGRNWRVVKIGGLPHSLLSLFLCLVSASQNWGRL